MLALCMLYIFSNKEKCVLLPRLQYYCCLLEFSLVVNVLNENLVYYYKVFIEVAENILCAIFKTTHSILVKFMYSAKKYNRKGYFPKQHCKQIPSFFPMLFKMGTMGIF